MNSELKDEMLGLMLRFRQLKPSILIDSSLNPGELFTMLHISEYHTDLTVSTIHREMCVSKPAVSQMLNSLERKGYIARDINSDDRRRIIVTLTGKGREMVKRINEGFNRRLDDVIYRLGEEDTRRLAVQLGRLLDIIEQMRQESRAPAGQGDLDDD